MKVLMTRPMWDKGFIDKNVVVRIGSKELTDVIYDVQSLSHVQNVSSGEVVITVRHYLDGSPSKEHAHQYMPRGGKLVAFKQAYTPTNSNAIIADHRCRENAMFSIYGEGRMLFSDDFNCNVKESSKFISKLKAIDEELYDFIVANFAYSYAKNVPRGWKIGSKPLPEFIHVRERLTTADDGCTINHTSDHWLLIDAKGNATLVDGDPTYGARIQASSGRTLEVYNNAPKPMPSNVVKAIRITIGALPINGVMKGISWTLYSKP